MNIVWSNGTNGYGARWHLATLDSQVLVSICERSDARVGYMRGPFTRWCVFLFNTIDGHCADLPLDMPEEELKAVAMAHWRMR